MARRKVNEFEGIAGNPFDWLWGRYQQRFHQRILVFVISMVLPCFLVSWLVVLRINSLNLKEFLVLWILAHEIFLLGFTIDHCTDLTRRIKESRMLSELVLTRHSEAEILGSLVRIIGNSMLVPFVLGLIMEVVCLVLLAERVQIPSAWLSLIAVLLFFILPVGYFTIRRLSLHITMVCIEYSTNPLVLIPRILNVRILGYYVLEAVMVGWALAVGMSLEHQFFATLSICFAILPILFYSIVQLMRLKEKSGRCSAELLLREIEQNAA